MAKNSTLSMDGGGVINVTVTLEAAAATETILAIPMSLLPSTTGVSVFFNCLTGPLSLPEVVWTATFPLGPTLKLVTSSVGEQPLSFHGFMMFKNFFDRIFRAMAGGF